MEVWAGVECTINRVGDNYYNQLDYRSSQQRMNDLIALADLGIKKIRHPILWEQHQKNAEEPIKWDETEAILSLLKERNIEVIAGLIHHGSGPSYVHPEDDNFSTGLAAYAALVAEKFPWIDYYTPINEPLTTARFSGLYGIWYPHQSNDSSFLRILYNECKATVLAMRAIRKVNPKAKLVHTEDLGMIHSTEKLQYQARFENERRWLGIDMLCGRLIPGHHLYRYCLKHGLTEDELLFFAEHALPPDILGFNYYITSERYLDEHIAQYPAPQHGGNGIDVYADVEAVRADGVEISGLEHLLSIAWNRFKLPLAITECHLYCGREDQLRWLQANWDAALNLEKKGVDIKGFAIWSAFGAYGWDKLLCAAGGSYESGLFDARSDRARPTALVSMVKEMIAGKTFDHPLMQGRGWWGRDDRILYPLPKQSELMPDYCSPILIIGATGTLGKAFARTCHQRNIYYVSLTRGELNLNDPVQIEEIIRLYKPWAVINAAGFVRVDDAEIEYEDCFLSNTAGPGNLADLCMTYNIKFMTFSSDLVFDGQKMAAYDEDDAVNPLNVYGASKAQAEQEVLTKNPKALVVRTSAFFSPWDNYNFVSYIVNSLQRKQQINVIEDVYISPTYVPDLVNASLDLLIDDEKGIWHLANEGTISWSALAKEVAKRGNYNASLLQPVPVAEFGFQAARPNFSALTSKHGLIMPTLETALDRYFLNMEKSNAS